MARIRSIKPEFFKHVELYDLEQETGLPLRLAFAGLWCQCDREGRFKWRSRVLKLDVLPFDECDFDEVLQALLDNGFIRRYSVGGKDFGYIPTWNEHQSIPTREPESKLPEPTDENTITCDDMHEACNEHVTSTLGREGKGRGKEGKGKISSELSEADTSNHVDEELSEFEFPTNKHNSEGEVYRLRASKLAEWRESYPAVDVDTQLRNARQWLRDRPKQRKTHRGMCKFLSDWLARNQNSARGSPRSPNGSLQTERDAKLESLMLK